MEQQLGNGLMALSLFSGGGGLDLGYERAGFTHLASYEWLEPAAATLVKARPDWLVYGGDEGDVRYVDWTRYKDIDVLHGGPPCQPFSTAGRQKGAADPRDMVPEFTRAVMEARPRVFQMENVPALAQRKFSAYVESSILTPLGSDYEISTAFLHAADFGVPQSRKRVFFVGVRRDLQRRFDFPPPTHRWDHLVGASAPSAPELFTEFGDLRQAMGARAALGLPDLGLDRLAPTLRSTLNGPRNTTSILSSTAAQRVWSELEIWPNGVAEDRERARAFVAKNGHFRLSVADCAILQGFPDDWPFQGATYMSLGQIGNAVPPPLAYAVAAAIARVLH